MKIAILTFHRAYNCGAMLQAWALKTVLERLGHEVEFPDCNHVGEVGRFYGLELPRALSKPWLYGIWLIRVLMSVWTNDYKRHLFRVFRNRYLPHRGIVPTEFHDRYNLVIVGSDQVWNPKVAGKALPLFLGETIPRSVPMIAYSISMGDAEYEEPVIDRLMGAKRRFLSLSSREESAAELLMGKDNCEIPVVLDPTMLLVAKDYQVLGGQIPNRDPYLFVYATPSAALLSCARKMAQRLGVRLVVGYFYVASVDFNVPEQFHALSPENLVMAIRNASYVITNSFHGTALSIVHGKRFLSFVESKVSRKGRIRCLLERLGIVDRMIDSECPIMDALARIEKDITGSVEDVLSKERQMAINYLTASIERAGA